MFFILGCALLLGVSQSAQGGGKDRAPGKTVSKTTPLRVEKLLNRTEDFYLPDSEGALQKCVTALAHQQLIPSFAIPDVRQMVSDSAVGSLLRWFTGDPLPADEVIILEGISEIDRFIHLQQNNYAKSVRFELNPKLPLIGSWLGRSWQSFRSWFTEKPPLLIAPDAVTLRDVYFYVEGAMVALYGQMNRVELLTRLKNHYKDLRSPLEQMIEQEFAKLFVNMQYIGRYFKIYSWTRHYLVGRARKEKFPKSFPYYEYLLRDLGVNDMRMQGMAVSSDVEFANGLREVLKDKLTNATDRNNVATLSGLDPATAETDFKAKRPHPIPDFYQRAYQNARGHEPTDPSMIPWESQPDGENENATAFWAMQTIAANAWLQDEATAQERRQQLRRTIERVLRDPKFTLIILRALDGVLPTPIARQLKKWLLPTTNDFVINRRFGPLILGVQYQKNLHTREKVSMIKSFAAIEVEDLFEFIASQERFHLLWSELVFYGRALAKYRDALPTPGELEMQEGVAFEANRSAATILGQGEVNDLSRELGLPECDFKFPEPLNADFELQWHADVIDTIARVEAKRAGGKLRRSDPTFGVSVVEKVLWFLGIVTGALASSGLLPF